MQFSTLKKVRSLIFSKSKFSKLQTLTNLLLIQFVVPMSTAEQRGGTLCTQFFEDEKKFLRSKIHENFDSQKCQLS